MDKRKTSGPKKIVITGGPGTGKSTVINELIRRGYNAMPEVSREVIREAKKQGIDQLFLTDPLLFSKKLIEGRVRQWEEAQQMDTDLVFFDRGIPDVPAYMRYSKTPVPEEFMEYCHRYRYNQPVFIMPPWQEIYVNDFERYESFNQAQLIHNRLVNMYMELEYFLIFVPFGTVEKRADFILDVLDKYE
ncbi:MAG: ATP-binding protein [Chlorobi bacterium]|nr:ATP-binding protein [Chlorobiota bacterium]